MMATTWIISFLPEPVFIVASASLRGNAALAWRGRAARVAPL